MKLSRVVELKKRLVDGEEFLSKTSTDIIRSEISFKKSNKRDALKRLK
jgi:hypothetical protein